MTIITRFPSRVLVLLTVIVLASFLLLASAVHATGTMRETTEYRVVAGDTLWEVAAEVTDPGQDVRAAIYDIKRMNGLDGSLIHPGQVLVVPAG